jgi:3-phytase
MAGGAPDLLVVGGGVWGTWTALHARRLGATVQLIEEREPGGAIVARRLREFRVESQPEGCVVDEAGNTLFIGEEKRGLWAMAAEPTDARASDRRLVLPAGGVLRADVEGIAVYRSAGQAYLVVSSQGNDSYVVLDAAAPHRVRGAFRIGINVDKGIDGASETDGLEVTPMPLGPDFPRGMLVVQDGRKRLPEGPQNYKYVSWEDIARALALP